MEDNESGHWFGFVRMHSRKLDLLMARDSRLRVYYGPDDDRSVPLAKVKKDDATVQISLHEMMETLLDAMQNERAWPDDFREENIAISTDLYEVISAYRRLRRSA